MWACELQQGAQLRRTQGTVQSQRQTFPKHSLRDLQPLADLSTIDWVQQAWGRRAAKKKLCEVRGWDGGQMYSYTRWRGGVNLARVETIAKVWAALKAAVFAVTRSHACPYIYPECKLNIPALNVGVEYSTGTSITNQFDTFFLQVTHRVVNCYLSISKHHNLGYTHTHTHLYTHMFFSLSLWG